MSNKKKHQEKEYCSITEVEKKYFPEIYMRKKKKKDLDKTSELYESGENILTQLLSEIKKEIKNS